MTTGTRIELTQEIIDSLAHEADARSKQYFADYDKATDMGHRRAENYAPGADLCSTVFYEYVTAQGKSSGDFARGTTGRILKKLKELHGVA